MKHIDVGNSGLKIPQVVFGSTALGNLFGVIPDETKLEIMRQIFNQMPKPVAIDSAGKYGAGLALEVIGQTLRALDIDAEDVVISNKLAWVRTPLRTPEPTFEPGAWMGLQHDAKQDISRDGILRCWEEGLDLLGGTYTTQMVSVHDPDEYLDAATSPTDRRKRFDDILAAYDALAELKAKGYVAAIGVGAKKWTSIAEITAEVKLDWVMFANSLTLYEHPAELIDFMTQLGEQGITILNSAVFNAGFLTGGPFFNYRRLDPNRIDDQQKLAWREKFFALCDEHRLRPSEVCVQFGISHPAIGCVALSTSKPTRVAQNIAAVEANIPAEFWAALKTEGLLTTNYPYLP